MFRPRLAALAFWLAVVAPLGAAAGTKSASTWVSPDLKPATYQNVVVLAKTTDDLAMRVLEDSIVKGLKEKGVEAVQAYLVLKPADLASDEAIEAKAVELGADGPRWIATYTTDLENGVERAAEEIAALALKQLKKARVFAK
jgi:hypothetical protein